MKTNFLTQLIAFGFAISTHAATPSIGAGVPGGTVSGVNGMGTAATGVGGVAAPAAPNSVAPPTSGNALTPDAQINTGGLNNNTLNNNPLNTGVNTANGFVLPATPDLNGRYPGASSNTGQ